MGGIAGSSGKNKCFEIPDPQSNNGAGDAGRNLRLATRSGGYHEIYGNKLPAGISTNLPVIVRNIVRCEGLTVMQGEIWFDGTGNNTLRLESGSIWLKLNGIDIACINNEGDLSIKGVIHTDAIDFPTP